MLDVSNADLSVLVTPCQTAKQLPLGVLSAAQGDAHGVANAHVSPLAGIDRTFAQLKGAQVVRGEVEPA